MKICHMCYKRFGSVKVTCLMTAYKVGDRAYTCNVNQLVLGYNTEV